MLGYMRSKSTRGFIWDSADHPYIKALGARLKLDSLLGSKGSDLERTWSVCLVISSLWEHDGACAAKRPDPMSILDEVDLGKRFRCVEYSTVMLGALVSVGIRGRYLFLRTKDVETRDTMAGHVAVEAYLADEHRWVLVDGQFGTVSLLDGKPANAWEVRHAIERNASRLSVMGLSFPDSTVYFKWLSPYLFFLETRFDNRVSTPPEPGGLMLVPAGAKEPTVMQRRWPIEHMEYVYSPKEFYSVPA